MRLTRATLYALYGLSCLATQPAGRLVPLSLISKRTNVPGKHLAKIFRVLVRAGILRAAPGPKGGFALARPAKALSALEIVDLIEGPVGSGICLLDRSPCADVAQCLVGSKLLKAEAALTEALRRLTVLDLAQPLRPSRRPRGPG